MITVFTIHGEVTADAVWASGWDALVHHQPNTIIGTFLLAVAGVLQAAQDYVPIAARNWTLAAVDPVGFKRAIDRRWWRMSYVDLDALKLRAELKAELSQPVALRMWSWAILAFGAYVAFVGTVLDAADASRPSGLGSVLIALGFSGLVLFAGWVSRRRYRTLSRQIRDAVQEVSDGRVVLPTRGWDDVRIEVGRVRTLLRGSRRSGARRVLKEMGRQSHLRPWRVLALALCIGAAVVGFRVVLHDAPFPVPSLMVIALMVGYFLIATVLLLTGLDRLPPWAVVLSTASGASVRLERGGGLRRWKRYRTVVLSALVRPHRERTAPPEQQEPLRRAEQSDVLTLLDLILRWADENQVTLIASAATERLADAYEAVDFIEHTSRHRRPRWITVASRWFLRYPEKPGPFRVRRPVRSNGDTELGAVRRLAALEAAAIILGYCSGSSGTEHA